MDGGCLCFATPLISAIAHAAGSPAAPFMAELVFKASEFEWVNGRPLVKIYEAPVRQKPPGYRRTFCALCGAPLPNKRPVFI